MMDSRMKPTAVASCSPVDVYTSVLMLKVVKVAPTARNPTT